MEEVYSLEQSNGKSSTRAKNKYRDKTYDRMEVTLPKGKKAIIQAHAETQGESLNAYVCGAVDARMEKEDNKEAED